MVDWPTAICISVHLFRDYTPVCGSDRLTYSNQCWLETAACQSRSGLQVLYQGTTWQIFLQVYFLMPSSIPSTLFLFLLLFSYFSGLFQSVFIFSCQLYRVTDRATELMGKSVIAMEKNEKIPQHTPSHLRICNAASFWCGVNCQIKDDICYTPAQSIKTVNYKRNKNTPLRLLLYCAAHR